MRRSFRFFYTLFAALIVMAGCDSADPISAPQPAFPRQADVVPGTDGKQYTLVEGQIKFKKISASAWINRQGGYVFLPGDTINGKQTMHVLYVPEGAVKKRTLFTISIASPHFIKVDLRAQEERKYRGDTELVDVGHLGFDKKILVALDWSIALNVTDPSQLTVLYEPPGGKPVEKIPSQILAGYEQWVIGYLDHFSRYALGM